MITYYERIEMSRLLAIQCGTLQMLTVRDTYDMNTIEAARCQGASITIAAYVPEHGEDRLFTIEGLTRARDGWGVEHIVGYSFENDVMTYVTFHDNPLEAHPLNLK